MVGFIPSFFMLVASRLSLEGCQPGRRPRPEAATKMWEKLKTKMPPSNRQNKNKEVCGSFDIEKERKRRNKRESGFKKEFVARSKTWDGYGPPNNESASNQCAVFFSE